MPILMFDANFFGRFVESPDFFNKVRPEMDLRYRGIPPGEMAFFVTPFAFLEYLGIVIEPPSPEGVALQTEDLRDFESSIRFAERVYDYSYHYFDSQDLLTLARIESALSHRRQWVCQQAIGYWNIATSRYSKQENRHILIHSLASEYMQKFRLKKAQATLLHLSLWIDAANRIADDGVDVCMFRTVQWRWEQESRRNQIGSFGEAIARRLWKSMGMKWKGDLLDCELVHYVVLGKIVDRRLVAVDGYTCDPPRKIKDRVAVFTEGMRCISRDLHAAAEARGADWIKRFPDPSRGSVTFYSLEGACLEGPIAVTELETRTALA